MSKDFKVGDEIFFSVFEGERSEGVVKKVEAESLLVEYEFMVGDFPQPDMVRVGKDDCEKIYI